MCILDNVLSILIGIESAALQSTNIKCTYKPYTLVKPTITRPVQDPLAVKLLDNQLYISFLENEHTKAV